MSRIVAIIGVIALTGCAVRLGGPKPLEYRTLAFSVAPQSGAEEVAGWIRQADANLVLLAAAADSAWFGEVARQSKLNLSGPGSAGTISYGFLAGEPVGDTTLVLPLEGGGEITLHDALYKVDDRRYLDLLAVRVPENVPPRAAVTELLEYIATDVMQESAVVLALDTPDSATGDAMATLLRPAFRDARACLPDADNGAASAPGMRLFFGPATKLTCEGARPLGVGGPLVARLILRRY